MGLSIPNLLLLASAAALGCSVARATPPGNDNCSAATPAAIGATTFGTCLGATPDGESSCAGESSSDVYHTITTTLPGVYTLSLCADATWDTVLSIHTGCPASQANEMICDDDGCRPPGGTGFGYPSTLRVYLNAGSTYLVRIAGFDSATPVGTYGLSVTGPLPHMGACCGATGCTIAAMPACMASGGQYAGDMTACILSTGSPQTYTDTAPPAQIPDNNPAGLTRTITVPDSYSVGDVSVSVNINHGFIGDLTMRLTHGAASIVLIQHVGVGVLGSDATITGTYVFSDLATSTIWPYAPTPASGHPVPTGTYLCTDADANPLSLRQAFAGSGVGGAWTLSIVDSSPQYTGQLLSWSLGISHAGASVCTSIQGACCRGTACTIGTASACMGVSGAFHGAGTVCTNGPNNPVVCCPANFNGMNGVDVGDIFAFLTAWFSRQQSADFNGNGVVDVADIFAFLTAWFAHC